MKVSAGGSAFTLVFASSFLYVYFLISRTSYDDFMYSFAWIAVQWMPSSWNFRRIIQTGVFDYWDRTIHKPTNVTLSIRRVDVQYHRGNLKDYLETTYGADWRSQPILLKNLWTLQDLDSPERKLSIQGLLKSTIEIPYFVDSTRPEFIPDARASVQEIVLNITRGEPHKISSQFLVQCQPELISEVAPSELVTDLFGDYFTPEHLQGLGPGKLLPPLTTVPVFIAANRQANGRATAFTGLHCEPIGNVAVQLAGSKRWTLVPPEFSHLLRPSTSPDGRAYFASHVKWDDEQEHIPHYTVSTHAGDAIWVPTWTWHRVDYDNRSRSTDISVALAGSLFHFRPIDFVRNNPLFAAIIIPAILLEIAGIKTQ